IRYIHYTGHPLRPPPRVTNPRTRPGLATLDTPVRRRNRINTHVASNLPAGSARGGSAVFGSRTDQGAASPQTASGETQQLSGTDSAPVSLLERTVRPGECRLD